MVGRYILLTMQSDAQQPQSAAPVGLPPVSPLSPQAATEVPVPPATPNAAQQVSMAAAAQQAQRLVAQYGQDPYRLNAALGELKANAQAAHYNITPNAAGN